MKDVEVDVDAGGFGKVTVGGIEVTENVTYIGVSIEPGRGTRVEIEITGDLLLAAKEADVTVRRATLP